MAAVENKQLGERSDWDGDADEVSADTLRRCQSGDSMAFRAFVVRYERRVVALLSRIVGRGPLVEDLAQDVFLRAFRALPGFDRGGPARVSTWLLTIATRRALDARKHSGFRVEIAGEDRDVPAAGTPETEVARARLGRAIECAANELGDEQRAAFVLQQFHGFSIREIAEALGIPENTAKTRAHRARQKMRELLASYREDG